MSTDVDLPTMDEIQTRLDMAATEGGETMAVHILHGTLIAIETAAGGNKLVSGRCLDESLQLFMDDLRTHLGPRMADNAARHLIRTLCRFLPSDMAHEVLNSIKGV